MTKVLPVTAFGNARNRGADYVRSYHHITVPNDTTVDDILRPAFWAHHANTLNRHDLIDILSEDGGLDMQVRVTGKGIAMVTVRPLRTWLREEAEAEEQTDFTVPDGYTVNFAPKQGWRVMVNDPHMVISKDHKSKAAAINAAVVHASKANAVAA